MLKRELQNSKRQPFGSFPTEGRKHKKLTLRGLTFYVFDLQLENLSKFCFFRVLQLPLKLLILLVACILVGCTGSRYHNEPHVRKVQPNTSQIAITRSVKLNTAPIWPLKTKGTYLQKITASALGMKETFSVHLTLEHQMIEVIAFNDVAGRLYRLKATPWNVLWEGSPNMPSSIKPENILGDFLLINLEAQQLSSLLYGAHVYENDHASGKTRTIKERKVLRTINYSLQKGGIWGHVVIKNPAIGYTLDIQTVEQ